MTPVTVDDLTVLPWRNGKGEAVTGPNGSTYWLTRSGAGWQVTPKGAGTAGWWWPATRQAALQLIAQLITRTEGERRT